MYTILYVPHNPFNFGNNFQQLSFPYKTSVGNFFSVRGQIGNILGGMDHMVSGCITP